MDLDKAKPFARCMRKAANRNDTGDLYKIKEGEHKDQAM
jgi:hypothetical protein